ncbi:Shg1p NDAI_0B04630 [Naumovozyma dairenensis CBS 421]|uniref:BOD1/SHG1 domain-containing protein n=1 Tax=Naumovozyma dairenensis (strain ATCC 10597 / BCRC 20456 / CBS 421 / NBRC 0211 / NRRL Y-12639) TaxID=1071378 RepID=G0W6T7_NAUDC|nr:hypothetical protein NDAI_0B04630 [Naumovozyma dairenensis CBS 421]CCD23498.1 hypothetical protein NDAI_0B04630 [Naumovozyma dairenensis CBS 421]
MSTINVQTDPAKEFAEAFKKQGYFDQLKREILSKNWKSNNDDDDGTNTTTSVTVEQTIKNKVADSVKDMVDKDPNLIFKNRGTTSALIEAQLFKDDYKKLSEGDNKILLTDFIQQTLNDQELTDGIISKLESIIPDDKK